MRGPLGVLCHYVQQSHHAHWLRISFIHLSPRVIEVDYAKKIELHMIWAIGPESESPQKDLSVGF